MKVTSARLAKIAGKYLEMSDAELYHHLEFSCFRFRANEIRALAASVLSQAEPKPTLRDAVKATKRLRAKRKVKK